MHFRQMTFAALALGCLGGAQAAEFKITITNYGPQPLSPLFYSAGNSNYDIFQVGGTSSLGIKRIAEGGNTAPQVALAAAAGSDVGAYGVLGGSPEGPGVTRSTTFSVDSSHGFFSFASMLGKTNDGFIGESVSSKGLQLFNSWGGSQSFVYDIFGSDAWDAGTELNTQNKADLGFLGGSGNPQEAPGDAFIRTHAGIIPGVGDSWQLLPAWSSDTHLATLSVRSVPSPAAAIPFLSGLVVAARRRKK